MTLIIFLVQAYLVLGYYTLNGEHVETLSITDQLPSWLKIHICVVCYVDALDDVPLNAQYGKPRQGFHKDQELTSNSARLGSSEEATSRRIWSIF
jgi:hypothetical protein